MNLLYCNITRKVMPRKKTALEKHVSGKRFNKEIGTFFLGQKTKSRKLWKKMKYLASILLEDNKEAKAKRGILCKYLKIQKNFNELCTYVQAQRLFEKLQIKKN